MVKIVVSTKMFTSTNGNVSLSVGGSYSIIIEDNPRNLGYGRVLLDDCIQKHSGLYCSTYGLNPNFKEYQDFVVEEVVMEKMYCYMIDHTQSSTDKLPYSKYGNQINLCTNGDGEYFDTYSKNKKGSNKGCCDIKKDPSEVDEQTWNVCDKCLLETAYNPLIKLKSIVLEQTSNIIKRSSQIFSAKDCDETGCYVFDEHENKLHKEHISKLSGSFFVNKINTKIRSVRVNKPIEWIILIAYILINVYTLLKPTNVKAIVCKKCNNLKYDYNSKCGYHEEAFIKKYRKSYKKSFIAKFIIGLLSFSILVGACSADCGSYCELLSNTVTNYPVINKDVTTSYINYESEFFIPEVKSNKISNSTCGDNLYFCSYNQKNNVAQFYRPNLNFIIKLKGYGFNTKSKKEICVSSNDIHMCGDGSKIMMFGQYKCKFTRSKINQNKLGKYILTNDNLVYEINDDIIKNNIDLINTCWKSESFRPSGSKFGVFSNCDIDDENLNFMWRNNSMANINLIANAHVIYNITNDISLIKPGIQLKIVEHNTHNIECDINYDEHKNHSAVKAVYGENPYTINCDNNNSVVSLTRVSDGKVMFWECNKDLYILNNVKHLIGNIEINPKNTVPIMCTCLGPVSKIITITDEERTYYYKDNLIIYIVIIFKTITSLMLIKRYFIPSNVNFIILANNRDIVINKL